MSAKAEGWVWEHSPYKGAAFIVHLAVADVVNDVNGNEFWAANEGLAEKARVGRQACNQALRQMVADGFLEVLERGRRHQGHYAPVRYRFLMPASAPVQWAGWEAHRVASDDTAVGSPCRQGRHRRVASDDTAVSPEATQTQEGTQEGTQDLSREEARRSDATDAAGAERRESTEGRTAHASAEGPRVADPVSTSPSAPSPSARAATRERAASAESPRANARRDAHARPTNKRESGAGAWPTSELERKGRKAADAYARTQARLKGVTSPRYVPKVTADAMGDERFVQLVTKHPNATPETLADKYTAIRFPKALKPRPGPPPPPLFVAKPRAEKSPEEKERIRAMNAERRAKMDAERRAKVAERRAKVADQAAHTAAGAPEDDAADGRDPGISTEPRGARSTAA